MPPVQPSFHCQAGPRRAASGGLPRVVIDLERIRHINCGLGRFSLHLGRELLTAATGLVEPVFFLPPGAERYFPGVPFARLLVTPWKKEQVQRMVRPFVQPVLPKPSMALWHTTNQMSRYLPLDARVPVVLTIHDFNFLHQCPHGGPTWEKTRKIADMQRKVDRAAAVVTISRFVARDVETLLDLRGKPLHVVPNGLALPPAASAQRPAMIPPGPFLLTVGNALPHKNFHILLGLVAELPGRRLVIAGKKATPYGAFLEREVVRLGLSERVVLTGEVSDGDRQWLYENCEAFAFPSLTEGFGFPVLEAMQCGKPVVMSRRTSLPEVAGDQGYFFDSFAAANMAAVYRDGVAAFAADPASPARARAHAARFSWAETARGYLGVYAGVLRSRQQAA